MKFESWKNQLFTWPIRAALIAFAVVGTWIPAQAQQVWDPTGNGLLSGNYNFREVLWVVGDGAGNLSQAVTLTGVINFNGRGSYTITASQTNSSVAGTTTRSTAGTYTISASGYGFMTHPLANGSIFGLVSNGVFVGSGTETGYNDFFVAAPAGSATNASFSGAYTMSYMNFPGGFSNVYGSLATLTADGAGSITGDVGVRTYVGANTTVVQQKEAGVKNSFSGGVGTLTFPTTTNLALRGPMDLFLSPDGNLIFGGTRNGYDLYVGVKNATDSPAFKGLYYQAGVNQSNSTTAGVLDTYYGALNSLFGGGSTTISQHQRSLCVLCNAVPRAVSYTQVNSYPGFGVNSYLDSDSGTEFYFSPGATYRIGFGLGPALGLNIAVQAPAQSGTGVFLDPTGVLNGASYAPFTNDLAPGELLVMFGTNLAPKLSVAPGVPFPKTLENVQVTMNGIQAALYYVSPTQVSAIVPYGITGSIVQIQVVNNGATSNAVTMFIGTNTPGVFSTSNNGIGFGSVLHNATGKLVTDADPAVPGEYLQVYATGLGSVFPTVADGAPGAGSGQLNQIPADSIAALIDNKPAKIVYAGLAPNYSGLYQLSIQVPTLTTTKTAYLDLSGVSDYTSMVKIPVVAGTSADAPDTGSAQSGKPETNPLRRR